ncbi:DUF1583 domain-containing protein [Gimesia aquarii]|nr:DUF1583 domain-containing protein [Gimesia aquarii]
MALLRNNFSLLRLTILALITLFHHGIHSAYGEGLTVEFHRKDATLGVMKLIGNTPAMKFTKSGLVIRKKPKIPKLWAGTASQFWVAGDFEITGHFEINESLCPPTEGYGTGVSLQVAVDVKGERQKFLLGQYLLPESAGTVYLASIRRNPKKPPSNIRKRLDVVQTTGWLRLVRKGNSLKFEVSSDGVEFEEIHTTKFSADQTTGIRFVVDTGKSTASQSVFKKLDVNADRLGFGSTKPQGGAYAWNAWWGALIVSIPLVAGSILYVWRRG